MFAGTIGLFLSLFFLFVRFLPGDRDLRDAHDRAGGEAEVEHSPRVM